MDRVVQSKASAAWHRVGSPTGANPALSVARLRHERRHVPARVTSLRHVPSHIPPQRRDRPPLARRLV